MNTLESFISTHDKRVSQPPKIKAALEIMAKGVGSEEDPRWLYENEFSKKCGVASNEIGKYRDQFAAHIVTVAGKNVKRAWFGSVKEANEARKIPGVS